MPGAATPQTLLEAIASAAGGGFITNPIPETPTGTNAASVQGGFPPVTMQNELSGGKPPLGQDMNGYLFLISSHTFYVQCGQPYLYDLTLATAIGGYLAGTILGMADKSGLWLCIADGTTSNPDTGGAGWTPIVEYGYSIIPVTGGTVVPTATDGKRKVIVLNGTLTSNLTVNLPVGIREWLIVNTTAGAFVTTVKTAQVGSVGVTVPQGGFGSPVGVYSVGDGNIYPTVAPLSVPIDQNPNPLTIVERTNAGYVLATYFNSNAPVDNLTAAQVITSVGDGFFRKNTLTNFESQMLLQGLSGQLVNGQVPYSVVQQWAATFFTNAALTGTPTAPTAASGTSNTQIATTAFANPGVTVNGNGVAMQFANGFILQIGPINAPGWSGVPIDQAVTFPRVFPNGCLVGFACSQRNVAGRGQAIDGSNFASNYTVNGMLTTIDAPTGVFLAIGN